MEKQTASQALEQLASADTRPDAARLRDIFNDVEAALAAGVTREQVHAELLKHGFKFSLRGFDTALYRLRKKKASGAAAPAPASAPVAPSDMTAQDKLSQALDPATRDSKFDHYATASNPLIRRKK